MITGQCHCGAVKFSVEKVRDWLTDCNCSACRRFGTLWLHAGLDQVEIDAKPDATVQYVWGDKMLAFHSCKKCGGTTHWYPIDPTPESHMAVNGRMFEPEVLAEFRIRRLDGADTWQYLDE